MRRKKKRIPTQSQKEASRFQRNARRNVDLRGLMSRRRGANSEAATEQRERARRTDGSQRPTESLAGEPKGRRQAASQPAGGGGGESTTQPPAGLNLRRFLPPSKAMIMISGDDFPAWNVDGNNSQGTWRSYFRSFTRLCKTGTAPRHVDSADYAIETSQQVLITRRAEAIRNFSKLIFKKNGFIKRPFQRFSLSRFSFFKIFACGRVKYSSFWARYLALRIWKLILRANFISDKYFCSFV